MPSSEKSHSAAAILAADHVALDKLLSALIAALDSHDASTTFACLDLFWARLAMHIRGEHLHLFPAILRALQRASAERADETAATAEAREAIKQLRYDHDFFMHELGSAINVMRDRRITAGVDSTSKIESVRQTIATVRQRLKAHNKLEEDLVYRLPAKLLQAEEQTALEREIRNELKNLPPRFRV